MKLFTVKRRKRKYDSHTVVIGTIGLLFTMSAFLFGIYQMSNLFILGERATGVVVDFTDEYCKGSSGRGRCIVHIVEFTDQNGNEIKFENTKFTDSRLYVGKEVMVAYDSKNSNNAAIFSGYSFLIFSVGAVLTSIWMLYTLIRNREKSKISKN